MKLSCLFLSFFFVEIFAIKDPIGPIYTVGKTKQLRNPKSYETCFVDAPACDPDYKYRSFDGSCNNLDHPTWGMTNTAFLRLFDNWYSDGIELPPVSIVDGSELPNARELVNSIFPDEDQPESVSLIVGQWSQFVAHDMATNVVQQDVPDCCNNDDRLACLPIPVPEDDPFYSQFNVSCLAVTRGRKTVCDDCDPDGPKFPVNGVTHALDGSQIYGSDQAAADAIREFEGGRMTMRVLDDGRCFLTSPSQTEGSCFNSNVCYLAGEARVNQHPQLTIMHTMSARAHNNIANALAEIQPSWDDETLYQETRRIVVAIYVHITYNEFLPNILTEELVQKLGLKSSSSEFYQYDPDIPNIVIVSFSNPVFRIFHSALQESLAMFNYHLDLTNYINLTDYMNSPEIIEEENNFDELILGVITQPMQGLDEYYGLQFEGKVFHLGNPYGDDLTALDVQRARDHGAPPYTTVLYGCTGIEVNDFDDLNSLWPPEKVEVISQIYKSVHDIDLFVAINFESKQDGHIMSPIMECLIGEQFYRWKNGDRFWYEAEGQPSSFTSDQIDEIKKISLSRLICDTSDNIVNITLNAWLPPSDDNPIVPCDTLPNIDLSKWL